MFLYGSSIWTSSSKENLQKLLRLQKRAARIILNAEKTATSVHLFNTLNWIPFYAESYVTRCTLTYKRLNGNNPEYINDLLTKNSDIHTRTTRYCKSKFKLSSLQEMHGRWSDVHRKSNPRMEQAKCRSYA